MRSCSVEMPGRLRWSSTKRRGPAERSRTISRVHLPPIRSRARASGAHWPYGVRFLGSNIQYSNADTPETRVRFHPDMTDSAGVMHPPEAEETKGRAWSLPERIGLTAEIDRLRAHLAQLVERSHPEVGEMLDYQLSPRSKYFRPVTIFACSRAIGSDDVESLIPGTTAAELLHNYATVTDDIVDRDELRRGKPALHTAYGTLPAVMTGAYLTFAAFHQIADDGYLTELFTELGMRVAAAECRQWRLRRRPADVDTWLTLAG